MISIEHSYLKDIMMACSATWLRGPQNPHDQTLVEASHAYAVRSIQECSLQMRNGISKENIEGLLLTSLLVAMHAFMNNCQRPVSRRDHSMVEEHDAPVLGWVKHFQGVRALTHAGWKWLQQSDRMRPLLSALPAIHVGTSIEKKYSLDFLLGGLREGKLDAVTTASYVTAVRYLSAAVNDPARLGLLGFPVSLSSHFLQLLDKYNSRALTIMGTFLAIISLSRRSESLVEAAKLEFNRIVEALPREWLPRMIFAQDLLVGGCSWVSNVDATLKQ